MCNNNIFFSFPTPLTFDLTFDPSTTHSDLLPPHSYYSSIQSLPKLSNGEMAEYLRETAQVCANSVKQYDPTVVNDPALMVMIFIVL